MFFGEGQASLSFSHLNKDDEGLYTLRIVSRGGVSDHSAFLFVRGVWAPGPCGDRRPDLQAETGGRGHEGGGDCVLTDFLDVRWPSSGAHQPSRQ